MDELFLFLLALSISRDIIKSKSTRAPMGILDPTVFFFFMLVIIRKPIILPIAIVLPIAAVFLRLLLLVRQEFMFLLKHTLSEIVVMLVGTPIISIIFSNTYSFIAMVCLIFLGGIPQIKSWLFIYAITSFPSILGIIIQRIIQLRRLSFILTRKSISKLRDENLPDEILRALQLLENQEIISINKFLFAIEKQIGKTQLIQYKNVILQHTIKKNLYILKGIISLKLVICSFFIMAGIFLSNSFQTTFQKMTIMVFIQIGYMIFSMKELRDEFKLEKKEEEQDTYQVFGQVNFQSKYCNVLIDFVQIPISYFVGHQHIMQPAEIDEYFNAISCELKKGGKTFCVIPYIIKVLQDSTYYDNGVEDHLRHMLNNTGLYKYVIRHPISIQTILTYGNDINRPGDLSTGIEKYNLPEYIADLLSYDTYVIMGAELRQCIPGFISYIIRNSSKEYLIFKLPKMAIINNFDNYKDILTESGIAYYIQRYLPTQTQAYTFTIQDEQDEWVITCKKE